MSTPADRLRDPVHFFTARGVSVLTEDHYLAVIKDLREKLAESEKRRAVLAKRVAELSDK